MPPPNSHFKHFGFKFKRPDELKDVGGKSFVLPTREDGAFAVGASGFFGTALDYYGAAKSQRDWILKYRETAMHPDVDQAIDDIVNEAVVTDSAKSPISIDMSDLDGIHGVDASDDMKEEIRSAFDDIMNLLDFRSKAYDIFRSWYVDGRLFYHVMIDQTDAESTRKGITELRKIDPTRIFKVEEREMMRDATTGATLYGEGRVYYQYSGEELGSGVIQISDESVVSVASGVMDQHGQGVIGHVHKAIRPANQLRMIEDALVIYRLSRAPERRIFYIDVGKLPKQKAEEYVSGLMLKYKNKIQYDPATGEVRDGRNFLNIQEDFWLPRQEGSRGTEITTLDGGQNLGELEDVMYFRRNLYKALNVPITRLEPETGFTLGRATEISRDEIKFGKFIGRLRRGFNKLFYELLYRQLVLKMVIKPHEWDHYKRGISFIYEKDSYFAELKDMEILGERLQILERVESIAGKYVSHNWIRTTILHQTDEDITLQDKLIQKEQSDPRFSRPDEGSDGADF